MRPGLTIEDGSLVVTDNYLKVRIPPGLPRNEWVNVGAQPLTGEQLLGAVDLAQQIYSSRCRLLRRRLLPPSTIS